MGTSSIAAAATSDAAYWHLFPVGTVSQSGKGSIEARDDSDPQRTFAALK
jgi:hypothetical protein